MADVLAQDDVLSFGPSSLMTTTEAPAPPSPIAPAITSRPTDNLQPRIDEAYRRSQEEIDIAKRSMDVEERNAQERERSLAPIRERQMELAREPLPQPPHFREPPQKPEAPNTQDAEAWLFASSLLGALAGAFTRNHQTNALAAFTGAMQGYAEGSNQKFEQNMKLWEAENRRAQEANQNALNDYREILENRRLSMEQMAVELQVAASQHDDRAMATAAKTKNAITIAQLYDKQAQALEQMKASSERINAQFEQTQLREQNKMAIAQMRALGVTPGQEEALIDAIGQYKQAPITGPRGAAIMNLVQVKYPDYDIKKWFDEKYRATIPARVEAAGDTAGARTTAVAAANIELTLRSVGPVLENAADAAQAVPTTAFPRLNQLLQTAAENIGDPALRNFRLANEEVAVMIARVLNPRSSQTTVSDKQHARELIATWDSPEAYQKLLENVKRIAEREFDAVERAKRGDPMPAIELANSAERELRNTPRQILPRATGGTVGGITGRPGPSLTGQPSQAPSLPTERPVNVYGQTRDETSLTQEFIDWWTGRGGKVEQVQP